MNEHDDSVIKYVWRSQSSSIKMAEVKIGTIWPSKAEVISGKFHDKSISVAIIATPSVPQSA